MVNESQVNEIMSLLREHKISKDEAYDRILQLQQQVKNVTNIDSNQEKDLEQKQTMEQILQGMLAGLLKLPVEDLDVDEELREFGLDSILQMKFTEMVNKKFGCNCTPTVFFELEEQTIAGLTKYIMDNFEVSSSVVNITDESNNLSSDEQTFEEKYTNDIPKPLDIGKRFVSSLEKVKSFKSEESSCDDIAIIGLDVRVPDASSADEFWMNLMAQKDCIREIPESIRGNSRIKKAGFVPNADKFDAAFFHISNREAIYMDPQQRLLLECVWNVFVDAGYKVSDYAGSHLGVFVGASTHDYADLLNKYTDARDSHISSGVTNAILANRVSYVYNFNGPSEVIDTACSSSLVALHRAVTSMRAKECALAFVAGVTLNFNIDSFDLLDATGVLSPTFSCKTLDESADGYARGEGIGGILLKPISEAIKDGDHIYGIIRGSAENHVGKAASLTAPDVNSQADVITRAMSNIDVSRISYVELHGTGTKLGDPVEIKGLSKAYKELYSKEEKAFEENSCGISTVKTNIGHLEAAAGIVGVIKVLLSMQHGFLPGLLHFNKLNSYISLVNTPFYVVNENRKWIRQLDENNIELPRIAGISSFGFGGTNAHVVIEEYIDNNINATDKRQNYPIILSAPTKKQLQIYAKRLAEHLDKKECNLKDVCFTLFVGREKFANRIAFEATDVHQIARFLRCYADNIKIDGIYEGNVTTEEKEITSCEQLSYEEVLKGFVIGKNYSFEKMFPEGGNRLALPGFPLNSISYWLKDVPKREGSLDMLPELKMKKQISSIKINASEKLKLSTLVLEDDKKLPIKNNISNDSSNNNLSLNNVLNSKLSISKNEVMEKLKVILSKVLFCDVSTLQKEISFKEQGMDSILGVEFIKEVNKEFKTSIQATALYDYPALEQFAAHIMNQLEVNADNSTSSIKTEISTRQKEIEEIILDSFAAIILCNKDDIMIDEPMNEQGLDVMLSAKLMKDINARIGCRVTVDDMYMYPSISKLAGFIASNNSIKKMDVLQENIKSDVINKTNENITLSIPEPSVNKIEVKSKLKKLLAGVLFCGENNIAEDISFKEQGLDSILGVEFINAINSEFKTSIQATVLYDFATLNQLVDYVVSCSEPQNNSVSSNFVMAEEITLSEEGEKFAEQIRSLLGEVLHCNSKELLMDKPLNEQVTDINQLIDFVSRINNKIGSKLTIENIYQYPTIEKLTNYLVDNLSLVSNDDTKNDGCRKDDIAIIGISLRVPGANNADEFWNNIKKGVSSISTIPEDRWNKDLYNSKDISENNRIYCDYGGFLNDAEKFDPLFFNISPAEAKTLDPNQRILMEEIWKAFEDAGYSASRLDNKKCAIYTGVSAGEEYPAGNMNNSHSFFSARIAYLLNLKSEALTIDTACSSSMVALTLACRSLWEHSSDMAIASGVSLYMYPKTYVAMCRAGMLSHKGVCSVFDNSADGFVPGEAVVAVVIKRLKDAIEDQDHIYGVIKGIGMNQDGKTNGITAPSGKSQAALERAVYKEFDLNPSDFGYIECHGTGTKLGDPIEISGLTEAFSEYTKEKKKYPIGSVKTNLGHTSAASGLVSLVKVLLSMKHNLIPPSINYSEGNVHIDFENSPFYVNTKASSWQEKTTKIAAINSFGMSGTNVHTVVEEYNPIVKEGKKIELPVYVVPISAKTESVLAHKVKELHTWLKQNKVFIGDLAYTMACGRTHFDKRLCYVVSDTEDLMDKLTNSLSSNGLDKIDDVYELYDYYQKNGVSETKIYAEKLSNSYISGSFIDWDKVFANTDFDTISAPVYPFERISFPFAKDERWEEICKENYDMPDKSVSFMLDKDMFFIRDNAPYGQGVVSTVGCLEFVKMAIEQLYNKKVNSIHSLRANRLLVVNNSVKIKVYVKREKDSFPFKITTMNGNKEEVHIKGVAGISNNIDECIKIDELLNSKSEKSGEEYLSMYKAIHHELGDSIASLESVQFSEDNKNYIAKVTLPKNVDDTYDEMYFHPSLLEGIIQAVCVASFEYLSKRKTKFDKFLSFGFDELVILKRLPKSFYVYCENKVDEFDGDIYKISGRLVDNEGNCLGKLGNFAVKVVTDMDSKQTKKNFTNTEIGAKECLHRLHRDICNIICEILEIDDVSLDGELSEYGFTSLTITELLTVINKKFGLTISSSEIFDLDILTVNSIATTIYENNSIMLEEYYGLIGDNADKENDEIREVKISVQQLEEIPNYVSNVGVVGVGNVSEYKGKGEFIPLYAHSNNKIYEEKALNFDMTGALVYAVSKMLDDAAILKEELQSKRIGIISCSYFKDKIKFYQFASEQGFSTSVSRFLSEYFDFECQCEDVDGDESNLIGSISHGMDSIRLNKMDYCICCGYDDEKKSAYAILLKTMDKVSEQDNYYGALAFAGNKFACLKDNEEITDVNEVLVQEVVDITTLTTLFAQKDYQEYTEKNDIDKEQGIYAILDESQERQISCLELRTYVSNQKYIIRFEPVKLKDKAIENKSEIIVLSAVDEKCLKEYAGSLANYLTEKQIKKQQYFAQFKKDAGALLNSKLEINQFGYLPDSITNGIQAVNQKFAIEISDEEFKQAPSIGVFLRYVYRVYREKIVDYYENSIEKSDDAYSIGLGDVAYTLQSGREEKPVRVALVVNNISELVHKLRAIKGEQQDHTIYVNNTQFSNLAMLNGNDSTVISTIVDNGNLNDIAKIWVYGCEIDWNRLPNNKRKKISLPGPCINVFNQ